ncbi:MAG: hypothetical protein KA010_00645 [Saprospiraceae bacterium]|nr:hypothetical protein [Saprospiraceae bacterium]
MVNLLQGSSEKVAFFGGDFLLLKMLNDLLNMLGTILTYVDNDDLIAK